MTRHLVITLCLATSVSVLSSACVTDPSDPAPETRDEADPNVGAQVPDTIDVIEKDDINRTRTSRSACPVDVTWCCDGQHNLIECDAFYCYYTGYYCGTW
jgi:hypothetical protein